MQREAGGQRCLWEGWEGVAPVSLRNASNSAGQSNPLPAERARFGEGRVKGGERAKTRKKKCCARQTRCAGGGVFGRVLCACVLFFWEGGLRARSRTADAARDARGGRPRCVLFL